MKIMCKDYRLINDFKKQNQKTIWKHLDAMAVNYAVYSAHPKNLSIFLSDFDVYLYCDNASMVVVCLDACGNDADQTYAESELFRLNISDIGNGPRTSKVWKLAHAVRSIENRVTIPVYGVLITEANISNADELYDMWDSKDVRVIDNIKRIKYHKIQINENQELDAKTHVDAAIGNPPEVSVEQEPDSDYEDFEKMLNDFIYMNNYMGNKCKNQTEDGQDNDSEDNSDWNFPETSEKDSALADNTTFPNGEIEMNQNLSVKVEILHPIADPRKELDKLVGCNEIKQRMDELVNLTRYNKMLSHFYPTAKQHEVSLHSLFLGRPGTGKTTICKIYGSLLHQVGALSKGHVVVCDRSTFIGTLWGDEERALRRVLDMAKGGVLMIDEAYLLNSPNKNDPCKLVIQLLMNVLADETHRDLAVVLCGYKEPMMELLDLNPGLQSRFPNKFEFQDFSIDELLEITKLRIKEYNYKFTTEAWDKYVGILSSAYQTRDPQTWGNARFIGNQLERIYIQHASRCVKQQPKGKSALLSLTPEDIIPIEVPRPKNKIGF